MTDLKMTKKPRTYRTHAAIDFNFTTNNGKNVGWSFSEVSFELSRYYDNRPQTIAQNFYFSVNMFNGFKMTYKEVKEFLNFVQIELKNL